MIEVADQLGTTILLPQPAQRVVSCVPSQTELLYDLGLGEEVVGITKFCVHPANWRKSKNLIGGTKDIDLDKVAKLKPDLIICNKEENGKEQVEALRSIAPVYVSDVIHIPSSLEMIADVSQLIGKARQGAEMSESIDNSFKSIPDSAARTALYFIWKDPWMVAGANSFISAVMKRAGLENLAPTSSDYPALEVEQIQEIDPAVVLLSTEPFPFETKHTEELKRMLPNAEIHLVDGELFSWYGSRLLLAPPLIKNLRRKIGK